MKKNKLALVVTMGFLAAATHAADYNGDLIIGFTAETGNDFEYDLGAASSLTNGQTWDLGSRLASFELVAVKWGVIGSDANTGYAYASKAFGMPSPIGEQEWALQDLAVAGIYSVFPEAGPGQSVEPPSTLANSWYQQTVVGPYTTSYKNAFLNPNTVGLGSVKLYSMFLDNSAPTLIGTFSLAANGVVTFTAVSSAPPAPTLSITRNGDVSSISFLTANNATYTLQYTNSTGLTVPVASWPASGVTITGDGTTKTFTDSTTETDRLYRVKAQ